MFCCDVWWLRKLKVRISGLPAKRVYIRTAEVMTSELIVFLPYHHPLAASQHSKSTFDLHTHRILYVIHSLSSYFDKNWPDNTLLTYSRLFYLSFTS